MDQNASNDVTVLARWRERMGISQRKAAALLGVSLSTYQAQERGTNWTTGKPMRLPLTLRLACAAREHGIDPI